MAYLSLLVAALVVPIQHEVESVVIANATQEVESQTEIDAICSGFRDHDFDGDGQAELRRVTPLFAVGADGPLVLVLVESRLGDSLAGKRDLIPRLERHAHDLGSEGYRAHVLSVELGESDKHQDGAYVLALRELLRAFDEGNELAGTVLIGHFPDAFIVRTCNWRKRGGITLHKGTPKQTAYKGKRFVRRVAEDVAHRADIVLADLDGRWEDIYVQPRTRLESIHAVFEDTLPSNGGPCLDIARGGNVFDDFFHVTDGKLEVRETTDAGGAILGHAVFLDDRSGDHECAVEDRQRPNSIARPDILVSRIDARGIALRPRSTIVGMSGEALLDDQGQPQTVRFASKDDVPHWRDELWEPDPELELRLLIEFLDRNHTYRTRASTVAWRPASIACDLGSGYNVMRAAAENWQAGDERLSDLHQRPTLGDFVDWMAYPAVLRTLRAHSDQWGSDFKRTDVGSFSDRLGGPAWSWTRNGLALEPSLRAASGGGKLDWFLLRTLWENGVVSQEPAFYHFTGCHGISPPGAASRAFDHPSYGRRQGGEALLFFGNGLALIGRSKVFYDEPKGFAQALAAGETFGAAWARYFELESRAPTWSSAGGDIGRKRAYFWSVLGDWTLRLSTAAPRD